MKTLRDIREALEAGTDEIVAAYKKATPGEVKEEDMPASPDEAGMAMDQAKFIGYVADEIMEYIQGNNEFPEWMQNKLSALHEKAKGVHAVMAGKYNESVEESFKPHMMYDPETGKAYKADKEEDHLRMKKMGYTHEKPDMDEAKQKNWMVTVTKPINKLKKGMKVVVPARNTAEAIKKALKKMGENPAAIGSGHLDVKLDEALDEKYRAPTKAEIEADKKKDRAGKKRPSVTAKSVNKKLYGKMMGGLKKEELDEISRSTTPMNKKFGKTVDPKKFDAYKKFVKQNSVDEPTVRMVIDNPNDAESKRMMKNKNIAKAVDLRKAAMKESVQIDEAKFTPKEIKMAIGIASDPRYKGGNMTGAAKAIDKIKKGLSDYPQVAAVLKRQNESVDLEEKLQVSDGMAKWIEDFQKSDAPQFVEKDKNERREMAIAAYLAAKRKAKNESTKAYGKSERGRMDKEKNARISPKDKETLGKLAAMMAKEKGKKK